MSQSPVNSFSVSELNNLRLLTYFNEAGTAIFVYDFILTFAREVSLIWPAPWTFMKVLFILTRYMPFIDIGIRMWFNADAAPPISVCQFVYAASSWLYYFGTAVPEIMLTIRTWAVWNQDWRVGIGLLIFFIICWIPVIPIIIIFVKSLEFAVYTNSSQGITGCVTKKESEIVFLSWLLLLVYETGMFVLMLVQAIRCYRSSRNSQLLQVVFRDGLLYYLYLFAFALANVIVLTTAPPELAVVLVVFDRFIHPILACRAILDIKGQAVDHRHSYILTTVSITPSQQIWLDR